MLHGCQSIVDLMVVFIGHGLTVFFNLLALILNIFAHVYYNPHTILNII